MTSALNMPSVGPPAHPKSEIFCMPVPLFKPVERPMSQAALSSDRPIKLNPPRFLDADQKKLVPNIIIDGIKFPKIEISGLTKSLDLLRTAKNISTAKTESEVVVTDLSMNISLMTGSCALNATTENAIEIAISVSSEP